MSARALSRRFTFVVRRHEFNEFLPFVLRRGRLRGGGGSSRGLCTFQDRGQRTAFSWHWGALHKNATGMHGVGMHGAGMQGSCSRFVAPATAILDSRIAVRRHKFAEPGNPIPWAEVDAACTPGFYSLRPCHDAFPYQCAHRHKQPSSKVLGKLVKSHTKPAAQTQAPARATRSCRSPMLPIRRAHTRKQSRQRLQACPRGSRGAAPRRPPFHSFHRCRPSEDLGAPSRDHTDHASPPRRAAWSCMEGTPVPRGLMLRRTAEERPLPPKAAFSTIFGVSKVDKALSTFENFFKPGVRVSRERSFAQLRLQRAAQNSGGTAGCRHRRMF